MKNNRTNKFISLALAVIMLIGMMPMNMLTVAAATTPAPYDGTPVTPTQITSENYPQFGLTADNWSQYDGYYAIRNAKELYGFAAIVNSGSIYDEDAAINMSSAVLLQDIVINETVSASGATYSWTPIGNSGSPFRGVFDGNGHTISGVYINSSDDYIGLFARVGDLSQSGGTIKNATLANSYICGKQYVGGIAGYFKGNVASVSNCKIASDVTIVATYLGSNIGLGGIVGYHGGRMISDNRCSVSNCVVLGKVTAQNLNLATDCHAGAIVGYYGSSAQHDINVSNCYYIYGCVTHPGGTHEYGKGSAGCSNGGCTILSSTSDFHTCVSVTHNEVYPTCAGYPGRSEYSYCLICDKVTSGSKIDSPSAGHYYLDATCQMASHCRTCDLTQGDKNPDNHIKTLWKVNDADRSTHIYTHECCGIVLQTETHKVDANAYCKTCNYTCEHTKTVNGVCQVCNANGIAYVNRNWDSASGQVIASNAVVPEFTSITDSTTAMSTGWYVLEKNVTISGRITITGTVNLILKDGYTLTASQGITTTGATLNIYGQSGDSGTLVASGSQYAAAIGGLSGKGCGTILISGGTVRATGGNTGAGIGGGMHDQSGGTVTVNGGNVYATGGKNGCGIGTAGGASSTKCKPLTVTIHGGYVEAKGTGSGYVGIGGGSDCNGAGSITITGGTVVATSSGSGIAGIGSGSYCNGGTIVITGGNILSVTSNGSSRIGASNTFSSVESITDGKGNTVSLNTITLANVANGTRVTEVNGLSYGIHDVKTLDTNKLYFYLPANTAATSITADGTDYFCTSDNLTFYAEHDWTEKDGECVRCGEKCDHKDQTGTCEICGKVLHTHSFSYSATDNTITATCENTDGCPNTNGGTFTISAPAELYTDGVIAREAVIDNKLVDTAAQISAVTYSTSDGKAPTKPGPYTASVTVEGETASVEFTLLSYAASVTIGSETKNYKTIDEAFEAAKAATAKDNCVVTLLDDITTDKSVDISSGVLTLDLNDHKLESNYDRSVVVGLDAVVTITDSGENGTVKNTAGTSDYAVRNKGSLTIESGTFEGGYAVYNDGSIILNDGVFNGDVWSFTGYTINGGKFNGDYIGINCKNGTLEINNGTFDIDYIKIYKGFVVLNGGKFTNGVELDDDNDDGDEVQYLNNILGEGKAYYNANGEMIVLTDGQIEINEPFTVGDIADEIARIKAAVDAYDIDTVTSADIQGISVLKEDIANVKASAGLTAEQTATLDASSAALDSLVEKLTEVGNEIKRIDEAVTAYDINTVTSDDKTDIEQLKADIKALTDGTNITAEERATLEAHDATLDNLLAKISSTADEINRIVSVVNSYDADTVKSSDKADIEQLIADIKALTDGQNITENERVNLEAFDAQADKLIAKIDEVAAEITRLEETVETYNINTVKSTDKDAINEIIGEIDELLATDNLTDDEITALEEAKADAEKLIAKIDETAAEIARIEEAVNAYDEATVKYSDYTDIQQLIADIKALTDGQNITADERANLEALDAKADILVSIIRTTADNIAKIESAVNAYDIDTVKSSDKADIENLIARIKKLTDGDNITDEQRTKLEALDTTLDELLAKISETADEIARLEAEAGKYDEATVKSSDLDALTNLDSEILALALTDNVTAEEKAKLEELHDKVFGLITKIGDVSEEIVRLVDAVDAYVFDSVKSSDKADIEKLIADIKALTDGDNITDDERAVLVKADETADALLEKIADTAAEIKRIDDAANAYDINTVTSADKADIEKLLADSKALQDGNNITEAEEAALIENDETLNALLEKIAATAEEIARIEDAVNGYNEETVKSSDAEVIDKLIEDIKALTDGKNITEDEKAALEALDATADELNEKIDEVAAEKKRVEDAVNGYSEETVKSSDTEAIEQLKDDIQTLIDSGNVTEEEIKALEALDATADGLTDKIEETAQAMADTADKADDFDPATVTSDDKDEINSIIADIDEIIASGNATQEEIADLNETKAELNALVAKFNEATAKVEAIVMPDKNRVTKFWEDEIEALIAEIETLLAAPNMGTAEKAKLNEYKAQAEEMLEIINTPKEYISCRFFYLIWDCLTWKYNGILWLFSKIFGA